MHILTDAALKRRSRNGDSEAQDILRHRRFLKSMIQNPKSYHARQGSFMFNLPNGILMLFVRQMAGVKIYLLLSDWVSLKDVFDGWKAVEQWRTLIRTWQGPVSSTKNQLLSELHISRKKGMTYPQLATQLNKRLVRYFNEYINSQCMGSLFNGERLLLDCGISEDEALVFRCNILERLKSGEKGLFEKEGPISPSKLRELIRYWERTNKQFLSKKTR